MGIQVGNIDKIEPAGDKMKVTFHYANKYKVPANVTATDHEPEPGRLPHHSVGAGLHRWPGAGR